jgi:ElaB/YqjD/DUF883 family membrane-anchored ribosome-binding protein
MISFGDKIADGIDTAEDIIERNTRLAAKKAKKVVGRSEKKVRALSRKYRAEAEDFGDDLQDYGRSIIKSISTHFDEEPVATIAVGLGILWLANKLWRNL